MRIILKILLPILLTILAIYLPVIASPQIVLERNNDLTEFFWPIIHYIKESILTHQQLPFWNHMFFMGTPLVSDPQNLYWYLPNAIFLVMPIDPAIILSYAAHSLFGAIGMYVASRSFGLSKNSSVLAACLFVVSPKLAGYIEAGHFGLVLSFAWLPWVIYSLKKLFDSQKITWPILLAISLSSIYTNHILTAFIASLFTGILAVVLFLKKPNLKVVIRGVITLLVFALVISPAIIAQQDWFPQTTRDMLLQNPDVYPKWNSEEEFVESLFIYKFRDSEKTIEVGIFSSVLAIYAFFKISNKNKFLLAATSFIILLISLNNLSPIYDLLISQKWYILLRVSTRVWFIVSLIVVFLAAWGFEKLQKSKRYLAHALAIFAVLELILINYQIISKPFSNPHQASVKVYEYLSRDQDNFRVFCTTRCLSQKLSALHNLKLADGYGTLQQKNYFDAAKQIGQYYSNKYSLSIPPFDVYLYQRLQPHSPTLAAYGIKYVISPHPLTDKNLKPIETIGGYEIYENTLFISSNYLRYTPNTITVDNKQLQQAITVPEIYNHNWFAYDQVGRALEVKESPDHTLLITANKQAIVHLKYQPYKRTITKLQTSLIYKSSE